MIATGSTALLAEAAALRAEIDEYKEQVEKLQQALGFWLPSVDPTKPEHVIERVGNDAYLLAGYEGPDEKSAETLGWIRFSDSITGKEA